MNTILRQNSLNFFFALIAALASLIITGFEFGINNNVFHIPYVLRYNELPSLETDVFYGTLEKFTSMVWPFFRLFCNEGNIERVFFLGHFFSRLLTFVALIWLFKENGVSSATARGLSLITVAVCPWLLGVSDVGGHGLFINYFTHSEATWGPLVASLVAAQRGKLKWAAAFAGIVFLINAFVGIWLIIILAAIVASNSNQRSDWQLLIKSALIFCLTAAPVAIWIALSIKEKSSYENYSHLEYIRTYYPGHFLIESASNYSLRNLAIIVYCGFVSTFIGSSRRFWPAALTTLVALLIVGAIVPHFIDNRFIFNLHLIRSAGVLQFLSIALVASATVSIISDNTKPKAMRAIAVLAVSALITVQAEPKSLLICGISLTILALMKLREMNYKFTYILRRISSKNINYFSVLAIFSLLLFSFISIESREISLVRLTLILIILMLVLKSTKQYDINPILPFTLWTTLAALVVFVSIDFKTSSTSAKKLNRDNEHSKMLQWVRESNLKGPFLLPLRPDKHIFNEFQLNTKKPVWVDWKQGAAVMWEPSFYWQWMPRYREVNSLISKDDFTEYAERNGINHIVLPLRLGECSPNFDTKYVNSEYSICVSEPQGSGHIGKGMGSK